MKKISDYNNKKLCECFDCFNVNNNEQDIATSNIELKDISGDTVLTIVLEKGKYLSYFGTRFAKVDNNGIISVFKNFMGKN